MKAEIARVTRVKGNFEFLLEKICIQWHLYLCVWVFCIYLYFVFVCVICIFILSVFVITFSLLDPVAHGSEGKSENRCYYFCLPVRVFTVYCLISIELTTLEGGVQKYLLLKWRVLPMVEVWAQCSLVTNLVTNLSPFVTNMYLPWGLYPNMSEWKTEVQPPPPLNGLRYNFSRPNT